MTGGDFCISIDLELAWGTWDKPSPDYDRLCAEKEKAIVTSLLELFARYETPATWAIVGRLLDREPAAANRSGHGDRIWYAPDLVELVRDAAPRHDIGSHGFAHIYFGHAARDQIRADLESARRVHHAHGLDFTSFVFPRDQVAHLDLLEAVGIRVFRSVDVGWSTTVRQKAGTLPGRLANLADQMLPLPPVAVRPRLHPNGLVELPCSMLLLARGGVRRLVRPQIVVAKAKLGLQAARRTGGIFHLRFHPSNFYYQTERQLTVLDRILAAAANMRDRGDLRIRTMKSYARGVRVSDVRPSA
jgi:hypothetical protein